MAASSSSYVFALRGNASCKCEVLTSYICIKAIIVYLLKSLVCARPLSVHVRYVCVYVCMGMYICMCMYVCMCMCMYVCVYVCMYGYVCVYVCMYGYVYMHVYVCMHVYECVYV